MEKRIVHVLIGLLFGFNLYGASSSDLFTINFKNEATQDIEILTHNAEPLAAVGGQEIAKILIKTAQAKAIDMDKPFFVVIANHGAYYQLFKLDGQVVRAARNKQPTITLNPVTSRMAIKVEGMSLASEHRKDELLNMVDLLDTPVCFDIVEEALLEKCGIKRKVKDSSSFYRRYLRKSTE